MSDSRIPYFKAWLIYSVATVLLAFFGGMAVGAVMGFIMGAAGVQIETIRTVGGILGMVVGIIVSFIMFRWTIDKFVIPAITTTGSV
jgi:hypothetical protein